MFSPFSSSALLLVAPGEILAADEDTRGVAGPISPGALSSSSFSSSLLLLLLLLLPLLLLLFVLPRLLLLVLLLLLLLLMLRLMLSSSLSLSLLVGTPSKWKRAVLPRLAPMEAAAAEAEAAG